MFVGGPSVSSRRILRASRKMSGIFLYGFLETRAQLFSERRYEGLSHDGKVLAGNAANLDRKSTRLNSSHANISYAVFCLKKKKKNKKKKQQIIKQKNYGKQKLS